MIAALYVETGGVYFGLPDVDPWDEQRDARLYDGPWPVVAHPPCARWCAVAGLVEARYGYRKGDDGGTFAAALAAVRRFGGVLEHPAHSLAWPRFDLPRPGRDGWTQSLLDPGWVTEVSQVAYGHEARKRTWLYYVGPPPPPLMWSEPHATRQVSMLNYVRGQYARHLRSGEAEASRSPLAFRDALLELARSAAREPVALAL